MSESELFDEAFLRRLEYLHVVARKLAMGRGRGERRGRKIGAGLEYADHRDYAAGDDPRDLDWSAYARLDRLLVRVFEEEADIHLHILLDASRSMQSGSPSKFDHARRLAAALAYLALGNLDRVSVHCFGGSGASGETAREAMPSLRGRAQMFKLLPFLSSLSAFGETHLLAAAGACVQRASHGGRRGVALLLSDFYDPRGYEPALDLLRHHRIAPCAIQIVDDEDARPHARGQVALVDCETGIERELTITPRLAAAYARAHESFCERLAAFAAARAVPYVLAKTSVPFDELVLRVLRERGFLG